MDFITTNSLYLCIDQGGHASRAIIFNKTGEIITSAYAEIDTQRPQKYFVEHQAEDVINSIKQSIQQILKNLGSKKNLIVAAGLATQRSNIVCWHKQSGKALSPIISWQDRRHFQWLEQFKDKNEAIHKISGLFMSPHYGASKLRWCIDNIPEVKEALDEDNLVFGPMSSFITSRLVDNKEVVVDPVNASRTQLWSIKNSDWDNELLNIFDIPASALPKCVSSIYDYGVINCDESKIPLQLVTGDQSAAMYAFGALQSETVYINTGTGAFLSRPSGTLALYGRRLLTSIIFQNKNTKAENSYVLEGTVNGAGSALDWLAKQYPETNIYENLPGWLDEVTSPPLFLNGISGLASPFWVPDFNSQFVQDDSDAEQNNLAEKAVAVVESIVFLLKASLDEMSKLSSRPQQIQITGGIASLAGLNQRIADLSKLPVYCPTVSEATSRGTAFLLAEQPARWPEQETGTWFEVKNNPELQQRYLNWSEAMLNNMREQ